MKCFGGNNLGQLGLNNNNNQFEIQQINSFSNISSIHCGTYHSIILLGKKIIKIINKNKNKNKK